LGHWAVGDGGGEVYFDSLVVDLATLDGDDG
jgi:hypothetical protein